MPLRCPEDFRRAYREVAARHPAVLLVDGPKVLEAASGTASSTTGYSTTPSTPTCAATPRWRRTCSTSSAPAGRSAGPKARRYAPVDAEACARHFGIDAGRWAEICRREAKFYELTAYIRYDPAFRLDRCETYERAAKEIEAGRAPAAAGIPGWGTRPIPSSSARPRPIRSPSGPHPIAEIPMPATRE